VIWILASLFWDTVEWRKIVHKLLHFLRNVHLYKYTADVFVFNMLLVMCSHDSWPYTADANYLVTCVKAIKISSAVNRFLAMQLIFKLLSEIA